MSRIYILLQRCIFFWRRVQIYDFCSGCDIRTVESPTEDMSTQSMFNVQPRPSQVCFLEQNLYFHAAESTI